jgi:hypothetical protein
MGRPNLLITTIGELSCLPNWLSVVRNYDIALTCYPEERDLLVNKYDLNTNIFK